MAIKLNIIKATQSVDTTKTLGFYNIIVLNKSTGKGVFGEHNGDFSYTVKKGDTIAISVTGYKAIYFTYKDSAYHKLYQPRFILGELSYMGAEVIVRPLKTLEELKEERAAIEKRPVPDPIGRTYPRYRRIGNRIRNTPIRRRML